MNDRSIIKPPRLRPGDTIGLVTPGRLARYPVRIERGIAELRRLGFEVKVGDHALQDEQTDAERVADLHAMFADPGVRAIMLTLAGEAATIARLLDLLDYDVIRTNPKVLIGQSAATSLILGIHSQTGLVTFHGPCLIQHFGNIEGADAMTVSNLLAVLGGEATEYAAAKEHADEFHDWDFEDRKRTFRPSPPWRALRQGRAQGKLQGGSLRALVRNLNSPYAVDYRGAVAFWDLPFEPDQTPDPSEAERALAALRDRGVFGDMAAMIAGKPYLYEGHETLPSFHGIIDAAIAGSSAPLIAGVDCGHTLPMLTLPVGVMAEVDAGALRFRLLEAAVE